MATQMVRVDELTHSRLKQLAEKEGSSISALLERAIDSYEREQFFRELNDDYARIRLSPKAWEELQTEVAILDGALMDGLDTDEVWHIDGSVSYVGQGVDKSG